MIVTHKKLVGWESFFYEGISIIHKFLLIGYLSYHRYNPPNIKNSTKKGKSNGTQTRT